MDTFGHVDGRGLRVLLGESIPIDACLKDGNKGGMYLFVNYCWSRHPGLFRWTTDGVGSVLVGHGKLYAEKLGVFTLHVHALGFSDSLVGEVLTPASMTLSVYDTTLYVGDELTVSSRVSAPGGGRPQIEDLSFYDPTGESSRVLSWENLSWAYPVAIRVLARVPGVACIGLTGYTRVVWLRIAVVDSAGKGLFHGTRVSPGVSDCRIERIDGGKPQPTDRAPPPSSVLADSEVAAGVQKAFAYEVCVYRRRPQILIGSRYGVNPDVVACADSLAALAPEWRFAERRGEGGDEYTVVLARSLGEGLRARQVLTLTSNTGQLDLEERRMAPSKGNGMRARIQGDQWAAIWSAFGCAKMHSTPDAPVAPSIDSLVAWAEEVWPTVSQGSRLLLQCDFSALRFRRRLPDDASDTRVEESGRFKVRYSPRGKNGFTVVATPVRWGKTGVLSYRLNESGRISRTLDDREPNDSDEYFIRGQDWRPAKPAGTR